MTPARLAQNYMQPYLPKSPLETAAVAATTLGVAAGSYFSAGAQPLLQAAASAGICAAGYPVLKATHQFMMGKVSAAPQFSVTESAMAMMSGRGSIAPVVLWTISLAADLSSIAAFAAAQPAVGIASVLGAAWLLQMGLAIEFDSFIKIQEEAPRRATEAMWLGQQKNKLDKNFLAFFAFTGRRVPQKNPKLSILENLDFAVREIQFRQREVLEIQRDILRNLDAGRVYQENPEIQAWISEVESGSPDLDRAMYQLDAKWGFLLGLKNWVAHFEQRDFSYLTGEERRQQREKLNTFRLSPDMESRDRYFYALAEEAIDYCLEKLG